MLTRMSEELEQAEGNGIEYKEGAFNGFRCVWHPDFPMETTMELVDRLGTDQPPESASLIQNEKGRALWLIRDYPEPGRSVVIKTYERRRAWDAVTYTIRETKAEVEWFFCSNFPDYHIPVPQALACGVLRKMGLWGRAFFIMEGIDPCQTLLEYLNAPDAHLHKVVDEIARGVAKMHEIGVLYRDLHGNNILVQEQEGQAPRVVFVDYHKAANTEKVVPDVFCMRDLAKLNNFCRTSHRVRRRFLVSYLKSRKLLTRETLHRWHEQVDTLSQEWWSEHERDTGDACRMY